MLLFDLLQGHLARVPAAARMVAYQMHERCDGTGYPRRRGAAQIHALAKVAAVADVFLALVSPRPHRPALAPYRAMETILRDTQRGRYDPTVVRALLRAVSLFPLGSYVLLSDRRVAKTIRANGERFDRPIVQIWQPDRPGSQAQVIDLSRDLSLRVERAVDCTASLSPEP